VCIPLPEGIKYTAVKTAIVPIINLLQCREEAMSYANLWAGLAHGITIPKTFIRIFQVVGCLIDHSYYHNMALGYVIFQCITVANAHHLDWDTLHGASWSPWPSFNARSPIFCGSGKKFSATSPVTRTMIGHRHAALHATRPSGRPCSALCSYPPTLRQRLGEFELNGVSESSPVY
jgi:hypothetical protein